MSNSLASDQVGCSVGPDVCPNYLAKSPDRQQTTKLPISSKRVNMYNDYLPTGKVYVHKGAILAPSRAKN